MTPLGWFFLILSDVAAFIAISIAWKASPPFDVRERWNRLARWWRYGWPVRERPARHGRHAAGRVYATPLVLEQVTAHANAIQQAAEKFLPAPPRDASGYRTLASYVQAGRPPAPVETPDKPPWMITTNALDAVPAQTDEQSFRSQHPVIAAAYDNLTNEQTLAMYHTPGNAFGVDRCEAGVLAAEEQMAGGYLP